MQCRSACAEFAASILAKVLDANLPEIDFVECHGLARIRRLGLVVNSIDEYAHPLIARSVSIDGSPRLSRAFDLDAVFAGLHVVVRVAPLHDQVGMPVEVLVFNKASNTMASNRYPKWLQFDLIFIFLSFCKD